MVVFALWNGRGRLGSLRPCGALLCAEELLLCHLHSLRALCIRSLCSSCLADSSIFFSSFADDCLAAVRAAEGLPSFNLASKGLSFWVFLVACSFLYFACRLQKTTKGTNGGKDDRRCVRILKNVISRMNLRDDGN